MRRILFFFILIVEFIPAQAQISRFREYRELVVQAEYKIMTNDIPAAFEYYQQAMKSHGYLMVRDLSNAALCAAIHGENIECALLMRELLRLGVPFTEIQQIPEFDGIWKDPSSAKIMSKADAYSENGKRYRNARYLKSLDSLNIIKNRYLNGNEEAGKEMAEGLLAVFDMWGMPGEQYTGVTHMDGTTLFDEIITIIAVSDKFSKHHNRLSKIIQTLLVRGCIYPEKAARWLESMSQKKILSPQTATDDKTRQKVRDKYILPPANLEYIANRYREEHPESSFILR